MQSKTKREDEQERIIAQSVDLLCQPDSYQSVSHKIYHHISMPSIKNLSKIVDKLRTVLFPGYFGDLEIKASNMKYYIGAVLDEVFYLLEEEIKRGFYFAAKSEQDIEEEKYDEKAFQITGEFISRIPQIRHFLATDVEAAYIGDPAAKHPGEAIFCYPSIYALTNHRIAHELYRLNVPLIPRIIGEMAHSRTGIDLHPGAQIDEYFFMDHGTGIVIGETSIIGKNVRVYQGVTLGAKSFPKDKDGNPIKGIARHPIVEDNVTIYAGATILGRITIGKNSIIGGNVWVTQSMLEGSRVIQKCQQNMDKGNVCKESVDHK